MSQRTQQAREILPAKRLEHVHYPIRDIAVLADQLAREGKEIIPLNIGDPPSFDFDVPEHLIEAVSKAMLSGKNGYGPSLGVPEALDAIRAVAERKGISNIQSVFITSGVSEGVDICLSALVNPGENVLTPCPEYPLYSAVLAKLGAQANAYYLDEGSAWQPDLEHMSSRIFAGTRAIVVINPNNPTGAVYSRETLETIIEYARQNDLVILSDEIYDELELDGETHVSIASLAQDVPVITFGGLSKGYLVPGWRLGWAIVSGPAMPLRPYIEGMYKLLRARLSANHAIQYAVKPALEGPQDHLDEVLAKLRSRRDLTVKWCNAIPGISCVSPRGAFYAFPRLEIRDSDEKFVKQLLIEKHVLVVHGSGFGQAEGTKHFRIVFLPEEATLERAYRAIAEFMKEHYS
ncbi:MAG: aminotransferase class I/II-fold pyridoxal phosphate-dependent enzyme [Acidobacteria bacterium]|nr:aminotransferase class I/II-fold pyridoxal phosphate-dependent enzyme [Acidobacteriota bacterium]